MIVILGALSLGFALHAAPSAPESTTTPDPDSTKILNSTQLQSKPFFAKLYQPIDIRKRSYGAFSIGYSQSHLHTPHIAPSSPNTPSSPSQATPESNDSSFSRVARGVFFGLERGLHWASTTQDVSGSSWSLGSGFMLGGYINGVAAQDYSLNFGLRASYLIARYVIPSIGISYNLQHIAFPNDPKQYNLHGANVNAGLFVNLMRGLGIKAEASYAYPLIILRGVDARAYGEPRFESFSFVVSICYYDFSI